MTGTLPANSYDDNIRIEVRWAEDDIDRERAYATELLALAPDIALASATFSVAALLRVNRTLPIVSSTVSLGPAAT